ncbi:hypothetical protein L2E82_37487 [Cichorium intybus]|uniref:Uncharacterized protein n=1 Tax=Cichorium intybus TaxID=13427 RepID=A0ACB9AEE2_CICIN|nr:hypothetical protein L2E82_37487 [Cichorium intybus]
MSSNTILTLMSKDKDHFTIEKELAIKSITIKNMLDEGWLSPVIPLPNVASKTLALVVEFLNKQAVEQDLKKFVDDQHISTLLDLTLAANYLDIKEMLDVVCQKIADTIKDKTVEEVREIFHVTNDFTPEEEAAVRAEFDWAYE